MIIFPELIADAAKEAGIPVPPNPERYHKTKWPQFHLFLCAQLGAPMPAPTSHWDNAKVIAKIKPEQCQTITWKNLKRRGFAIGYSK